MIKPTIKRYISIVKEVWDKDITVDEAETYLKSNTFWISYDAQNKEFNN